MTITVVIPHLVERADMLQRSMASVMRQTFTPEAVIVVPDPDKTGEAATRNRGIAMVKTPFVAFLDDDDEMLPDHLERLLKRLTKTGADLAWSNYSVVGPDPDYRASFIEISTLVRTKAIKKVGGFPKANSETWPYNYPDWGMLANLLNAGFVFRKVKETTWIKHIHDSNICGVGF